MSFITLSNATFKFCGILCEDEWSLLASHWILQLSVFKFRLIILYKLERFLHDLCLSHTQARVMVSLLVTVGGYISFFCLNTIGREILHMTFYRIASTFAGLLIRLLEDLLDP